MVKSLYWIGAHARTSFAAIVYPVREIAPAAGKQATGEVKVGAEPV
jgi:hypothetical protein